MTPIRPEPAAGRISPGRWQVLAAVIVATYAIGLCRDLTEPWIGLHDWNGAFFSQLARNLDRYPFEIHHGMPIVAVGKDAPPPAERSIYATHPPGLVWLVAAAFRIVGESESAARGVPIVASVAGFVLLIRLWREAFGVAPALIAASFYAVMPMSVYFGRMVNHEAVCLFAMLAAVACWVYSHPARAASGDERCHVAPARSATMVTLCAAFLVAGCWIDWSSCLFAAIFLAYALVLTRSRAASEVGAQRRSGQRAAVALTLSVAAGGAAMVAYVVYAGLGGRWADLVAIFFSRATDDRGIAPRPALAQGGDAWRNTVENLSWPLLILAAIGLVMRLVSLARGRSIANAKPEALQAAQRQIAARAGLATISVTGLVWMAVFPKQYVLHQYWPFYLGPAIAMCAARAVLGLARPRGDAIRLESSGRQVNPPAQSADARAAPVVIVLVAVVIAWIGQLNYFDHEERAIVQAVEGWRRINEITDPGARILLRRDPVWPERRGGYLFRNIVPPQFAYYADRAFSVEPDPAKAAALAASGRYALFVLSEVDVARLGDSLSPLRSVYKEVRLSGALVAFDLRPALSGGSAEVHGRPQPKD